MRRGVRLAVVVLLAGCGGSLKPNGATGGCPGGPLGLAYCSVGCAQETTTTICQNGVWQCPPGLALETVTTCPSSSHLCDRLLLPLACSCDPASGDLSCDGGGMDGSACPTTPALRRADGTVFTCVSDSCTGDAAVRPICLNGGLACPPDSGEPGSVCPASSADAGAAGHPTRRPPAPSR